MVLISCRVLLVLSLKDALNIAKKENEEADTENKHLQNKTQLQRDIAYLG